jgi:hypothetical protein
MLFGNSERQNIILSLKSAPTLTLVSRTEAKNYLKIDSSITADDTLVDDIIATSQAFVESQINQCLVTQEWIQLQEGGCETFELAKSPIIGNPAIEYYSDFDTVTASTLTVSTDFRVVGDTIYNAGGYFDKCRLGDGYKITYSCGMFTASNYTNSTNPSLKLVKTAMLRFAAWAYENREEFAGDISETDFNIKYSSTVPNGIKNLLMPLNNGKNIL